MNDRPSESHVILDSGVEDGIEWCVCAAPIPAANGYAKLPEGHPWLGLDWDAVPADAPGGVTFARNGWVGFDTLHLGDVWTKEEVERLLELGAPSDWRIYPDDREGSRLWSVELVIEEAKRLARQVATAS